MKKRTINNLTQLQKAMQVAKRDALLFDDAYDAVLAGLDGFSSKHLHPTGMLPLLGGYVYVTDVGVNEHDGITASHR